MSINITNITKKFEDQLALNNVSFSVETGQIAGFIGPNGAGKSTLMRILCGIIPYDSGELNICGFDPEKSPMELKKIIGFLPESNPLYYEMYIKEYLEYVAGLYYKNKNKLAQSVDLVISETGLKPEIKKKIGNLSKGYKQRVGIAQALLPDPKVLILDEPTSGLDPNQLFEIRELIRGISKDKTILLSTHIMQEVEAICDKIILINKGEIVANDKTENIKKLKTTEFDIFEIEFENEVDIEKIKSIKGIRDIRISGKKVFIEAESDSQLNSKITELSFKENLPIVSMSKKTHGLDEIFMHLTSNKIH